MKRLLASEAKAGVPLRHLVSWNLLAGKVKSEDDSVEADAEMYLELATGNLFLLVAAHYEPNREGESVFQSCTWYRVCVIDDGTKRDWYGKSFYMPITYYCEPTEQVDLVDFEPEIEGLLKVEWAKIGTASTEDN